MAERLREDYGIETHLPPGKTLGQVWAEEIRAEMEKERAERAASPRPESSASEAPLPIDQPGQMTWQEWMRQKHRQHREMDWAEEHPTDQE